MFYVMDNYAHTLEGEATTREQALEILHDLETEGIFVWSIIEAQNKEELQSKIGNKREEEMSDLEALQWCYKHEVQVTFNGKGVSLIDPFIIKEDQTPITGTTLARVIAKVIATEEE